MNAKDAARHIADECLAMRSRRLSRAVTRIFDGALRPLGISAAQLSLLVVIQRCEPVSPKVVGQMLDIEKSTLSRNLQRLEDAGLIQTRLSGPGKQASLTASGRKRIADAYPLWRRAQRAAHDVLGRDRVAALWDEMQ